MNFSKDVCTYFATNRLARYTEKIANRIYLPTGMAPVYSYILMTINENDDESVTLTDLSELLSYSVSTMSRFVSTLEAKGLVEKRHSGRKVSIALTSSSDDMLKMAYECYNALFQKVDEIIGGAEERKELIELTTRIADLIELSDPTVMQ